MDTAIQCIYRDLEYAKSLIKSKTGKNAVRRDSIAAAKLSGEPLEDEDEEEENWTFVGGGDTDVSDEVDHDASTMHRTMDGTSRLGLRKPAIGSRVSSGVGSGAVGAAGQGVS